MHTVKKALLRKEQNPCCPNKKPTTLERTIAVGAAEGGF